MDEIKKILAEAYDDARTAGIGDDGGSEPTYASNAAEIILEWLEDAGFEIVRKAPSR